MRKYKNLFFLQNNFFLGSFVSWITDITIKIHLVANLITEICSGLNLKIWTTFQLKSQKSFKKHKHLYFSRQVAKVNHADERDYPVFTPLSGILKIHGIYSPWIQILHCFTRIAPQYEIFHWITSFYSIFYGIVHFYSIYHAIARKYSIYHDNGVIP